jgi:type I restriction enzyme M protein
MSRRLTAKSGSAAAEDVYTADNGAVPTHHHAADNGDDADVVQDGRVLDFISGAKELKETAKEQVRQRIARALFHEYGISVEDMGADFPVSVGGRRRRVDIAIFRTGLPHAQENLRRVVICRPEPIQSKRVQ